MHGEMSYMAEETRLERRKEPESMLEGIRTVIALGMKHVPPPYSLEEGEDAKESGTIAAYTHGDDCHDVMKRCQARPSR
jgi:epoxyqueuosine reductase